MRNLIIGSLIAGLCLAAIVGPGPLWSGQMNVAEANPGTQWNAQYFNNPTLSGSPVVTRIDDRIDFNWAGGSPDPAVPADNFSARWTKTVNFPTSGKWTFRVGADDGVRMWIDVTPIVDEWHGNPEGYRTYEVSIDQLTAGNHDLKVEYYEAGGNAGVKVEWYFSGGGGGGAPAAGTVYGPASWNASYYNNLDLSGAPSLTRVDGDINFDWGAGSPAPQVNADNFSVRWTATVNIPTTGRWRFQVGADDGVRMWIDVTQILNEWHGNPEGYRTYDADVYALTAGNHDLKVEYYEATGNARVQVRWFLVEGVGGGGAGAVAATPPPPPARVLAAATGDNVNVRTGPGLGNPVIAQISYPDDYVVLGGVPDLSWLLIDLGDGRQGWVSNEWVYLYSTDEAKNQDTTGGGQPDFVDDIPRLDLPIAPPALPPEGPPRRMLQGLTTDTVRMRDGASLYASQIIGSVPQGASLTVEARSRNGAWYLVSYQGIRGWVSAPYVTLLDGQVGDLVVSAEVVPTPPAGSVFVPQAEQAVTVRGQATANLKVRNAASIRGAEIGEIPSGAEFVVLGRNTTGAWYLVTYNGLEGWVYSPLVTLVEGRVPDLPIR
ncbi:MAG: hypothetical protein Kow00106_20330 [Anaerolineae bacterium]